MRNLNIKGMLIMMVVCSILVGSGNVTPVYASASEHVEDIILESIPTTTTTDAAVKTEITDIKVNNKVLVIIPELTGDDIVEYQEKCKNYLYDTLKPLGYDVDIRCNTDSDIFSNMDGYGFIFIYTHGVSYVDDKMKSVGLQTASKESIPKENTSKKNASDGYVYVSPKYIYENNPALNNSVVFLGACHSSLIKDGGLMDAFRNNGTELVMGFDTLAYFRSEDYYDATKMFVEGFILDNKSIGESLTPMKEKNVTRNWNFGDIAMSAIWNDCILDFSYDETKYGEDSILDVEFLQDENPTVIKPGESIIVTNNIDNPNGFLPIKLKADDEKKSRVDIVKYFKSGEISYISHDISSKNSSLVGEYSKTKITNLGDCNINVHVLDNDRNPIEPCDNVLYTKTDEPSLKIITLQPNEIYSVENHTGLDTSVLVSDSSSTQTWTFNRYFPIGTASGFYGSNKGIKSVRNNKRVDILNDNDKPIEIYLDKSTFPSLKTYLNNTLQ